VLMFNGETGVTLNDLPPSTKTYFKRLPGHDTLRMILAARSILVEGPSDELIVQRAFCQTHGCMPLEAGVEVISVSLAFKRFLDIARKLNLTVAAVRDNDGDAVAKKALFADYEGEAGIKICIDGNDFLRSLEPQLLAVNGREKLNRMLRTACDTDDDLLSYMTSNKADCALTLFESAENLTIPGYIQDAVA
jgi:putative ATP-dependent endonuclease of the OLD family